MYKLSKAQVGQKEKFISRYIGNNLTSGEANYILGKNGSNYERVGGFDVVVGGKVAFGEWCDVIIHLPTSMILK